MKIKLISLLSLLLCSLLCLSFVGCSDASGKDESTKEPELQETFEPALNSGEKSELYKRYAEYKENSELAFKANSPASPDSFVFDTSCEGVTIKEYVGEDNIVVVPGEIGGIAVTHIEAGAFSGKNIRALYFPDSIEYIADGLLVGCDSLATLRIPRLGEQKENFLGRLFGATAPDENAVKVPPSLDMLILGEGTSTISVDAFLGCKTLSAVILPDSVESIGDTAFYECIDLVYLSLGGGVKEIGEYAFAYCRAMYGIDISTAEKVGRGALFGCTALNNVKLTTQENDFLGRIFGAEKPEYNADFVPESLRSVEIAEGSKTVPDRMFSSCKYITEIILPKSLESIGIRAFYACRSLGKIEMTSVKTVSDDAFFGCDNLVEVELGDDLEALGMQAFFGCRSLKSVTLPNTLAELKPSTFYFCSSLVTVELGGVKKIGKDAFAGCTRLTPVSCEEIEIAEGNDALLPN